MNLIGNNKFEDLVCAGPRFLRGRPVREVDDRAEAGPAHDADRRQSPRSRAKVSPPRFAEVMGYGPPTRQAEQPRTSEPTRPPPTGCPAPPRKSPRYSKASAKKANRVWNPRTTPPLSRIDANPDDEHPLLGSPRDDSQGPGPWTARPPLYPCSTRFGPGAGRPARRVPLLLSGPSGRGPSSLYVGLGHEPGHLIHELQERGAPTPRGRRAASKVDPTECALLLRPRRPAGRVRGRRPRPVAQRARRRQRQTQGGGA